MTRCRSRLFAPVWSRGLTFLTCIFYYIYEPHWTAPDPEILSNLRSESTAQILQRPYTCSDPCSPLTNRLRSPFFFQPARSQSEALPRTGCCWQLQAWCIQSPLPVFPARPGQSTPLKQARYAETRLLGRGWVDFSVDDGDSQREDRIAGRGGVGRHPFRVNIKDDGVHLIPSSLPPHQHRFSQLQPSLGALLSCLLYIRSELSRCNEGPFGLFGTSHGCG